MYAEIDVSTIKGNGFKNIIGEKFGRLTVTGLSDKKGGRKRYWICECDCGNTVLVRSDNLRSKTTMSCGCFKKEQDKINLAKNHKGYNSQQSRLYHIWQGMRRRCENTSCAEYPEWGGRGITVCDEWSKDYKPFMNWSASNGYRDFLSIDRIDVNGNYEPSNCRWVTAKVQANNRRSNINVEYNGEIHNLSQWGVFLGIKQGTLYERYRKGDRGSNLFRPVIK